MKRLQRCSLGFVMAVCCLAGSARAQFKNGSQATELKLPTLSQRSITTQQIGLTNITLNYCRPLAAGRTLFGKEIAYGKVWRGGGPGKTTVFRGGGGAGGGEAAAGGAGGAGTNSGGEGGGGEFSHKIAHM